MYRMFFFTSLSLLLFLGLVTISVRELRTDRTINVIVITGESLRDELVNPQTMPRLMEHAVRGYRFYKHRAISGWTGTNIVSLLSGLSPFDTGVHTRGQSLNPDQFTPLEQLAIAGYQVEGLQGFMSMDIYKNLGLTIDTTYHDLRYALALRKQQRKPFFTWYHYVHTHLPYGTEDTVLPDFEGKGQQDSLRQRRLELVQTKASILHDQATYTSEDIPAVRKLQEASIEKFDKWLDELFIFLQKSGLDQNSIVILTADHGDEHGERGMVGHASTTLRGHLHEEIVHVPLLIWLPPSITDKVAQHNSMKSTDHRDLLVTIFELLGLSPEMELEGVSVFSQDSNTWTAMTSSGGFSEPEPSAIRFFEYGTIDGPWKLLSRHDQADGKINNRLYHLEDDPSEQNDLSTLHPEIVERLVKRLEPLISRQIIRPVAGNYLQTDTEFSGDAPPRWLFPERSGTFSYNQLAPNFELRWSGPEKAPYVIEYSATIDDSPINGFLETDENRKDFGKISRLYWNTWIVKYQMVKIRVKQQDGPWSDWLQLEPVE